MPVASGTLENFYSVCASSAAVRILCFRIAVKNVCEIAVGTVRQSPPRSRAAEFPRRIVREKRGNSRQCARWISDHPRIRSPRRLPAGGRVGQGADRLHTCRRSFELRLRTRINNTNLTDSVGCAATDLVAVVTNRSAKPTEYSTSSLTLPTLRLRKVLRQGETMGLPCICVESLRWHTKPVELWPNAMIESRERVYWQRTQR